MTILSGWDFCLGTLEFGEAFETYLMHELVSYSDYISGEPLSYLRSTSAFEVDFILGNHTAIKAKAKENLLTHDSKPLQALAEKKKLKRYLCLSLEPRRRILENLILLSLREFLEALWNHEYS